MTGPVHRLSHDSAEELISARLTNDLTDAERRDLDAHLAGCERCRATAASFAESRQLLSGIRHVPAPRDLGARVRAGLEGGRPMDLPWYRRPVFAVASVGALAAAAVVMAVIVSLPNEPPPVATTPSASATSASPTASDGAPSPSPTAPVSASPAPSVGPAAPAYRVEYAFDVPGDITQGTTVKIVEQASGDVVRTLTPGNEIFAGVPTEAKLSPDGSWLALRLFQDAKGTELLYAIQLDGDAVVSLGESLPDPFAATVAWSSGPPLLAYTVVDAENGAADAWIFDPSTSDATRLTDTGDAYAASWWPSDTSGMRLWISRASGSRPTSYAISLDPGGDIPGELDPATSPAVQAVANDVFAPLWSPDGANVLFWSGAMEQTPTGWRFVDERGIPELGVAADIADLAARSTPVFAGYTDGLASARMAWNASSNAYVIWAATGSDDPAYPDETRVYFAAFAQRTDPLLDASRVLDVADIPDGGRVVDVALAPDARHLAITAAYPIPGDLAQPVAELILVTRNYGGESDVTEPLGPAGVWVGPGIYAP